MSFRSLVPLATAAIIAALPLAPGRAHARLATSLRSAHPDLVSVGAEPLPDATFDAEASTRVTTAFAGDTRPALTESQWYGGEILACDGLSIATAVGFVGIGGYFLAPPIIHAAHGRWGAATLSLAMRVALPIAGGMLAESQKDCSGPHDPDGGLVPACNDLGVAFVVALGVITAMVLDATVLSYEDVPARTVAKARGPRLGIAPWIGGDRKGVSLAVAF